MIKVSQNALKQMNNIINNTSHANALFLSLKSGGCVGFKYELQPFPMAGMDKLIDSDVTEVLTLNKNKFLQVKEDRYIPIHISGKSLMYIVGTEIDWRKDYMGNRFTFDNPQMSNSCGCGSSFNFKHDDKW